MNIHYSDFVSVIHNKESLRQSVFNDQSIRRLFEWIGEYADAAAFRISQDVLSVAQHQLSSNTLDWRLITHGAELAKKLRPIWIESANIGWMVWPVSQILDEQGLKSDQSLIMIAHFSSDNGKPIGIPLVGYLKISDLHSSDHRLATRETMASLLQLSVAKSTTKLLVADAVSNGGTELDVRRFMQVTAAENAANFMIGLYFAFSYFKAPSFSFLDLYSC